MGYIYMLENKINGKIYIGQTIRSIKIRFKEHQTSSDCKAIYRAIQKYGWDAFEKDWYECPDEDLNFYEEMLVALLGTLAPGGYNLKEGGGNGKLSEETKQKISESHRGEKSYMYGKSPSEETKQKMSEAQRGEKHHMYGKSMNERTKQKLREAHIGKLLSEETKRNMSDSKIGILKSDATKQKMSESKKGDKNPMSKRVYQYALDGTFIDYFGSAREAGTHLKNDGSGIGKCACGHQKTAYGFRWSYIKNDIQSIV